MAQQYNPHDHFDYAVDLVNNQTVYKVRTEVKTGENVSEAVRAGRKIALEENATLQEIRWGKELWVAVLQKEYVDDEPF